MWKKIVPILEEAVNEDPELFTQAWAQITAAVYVMSEAIDRFDIRLGNISCVASGPDNCNADSDGGKRKRVHSE